MKQERGVEANTKDKRELENPWAVEGEIELIKWTLLQDVECAAIKKK